MRKPVAALFAATVVSLALASFAGAAPTEVDVRIEGKSETLFEGPILSDGHDVQGLSDTQPRHCDGLNNGANPVAGATPTAASVDAMRIAGEPFDGDWFDQFDDYFITQWGPDREDDLTAAYWGVLVNDVFTSVGGCQYQLAGGDDVLWIYDAFSGRERLALYPPGYVGGAPLTATATLNQPFEVEVDSWATFEGESPATQRATAPYEGAQVAPVITAANGFQRPDVASAATVTTAADGKASITFTTPGWHRIKATHFAAGVENVIRSNRLDVCVPQPPAGDCGAPPADAQLRTPPPLDDGGEDPGDEEPGSGGPGRVNGGGVAEAAPAGPTARPLAPPPTANHVVFARARIDRSRLAGGVVGVSWQLRDPGPGVRRWTIASKRVRKRGAGFVTRARGNAKTSARVRLPLGATYRLQLTVVDALGHRSVLPLGTVRVPGP